MRNTFYAFDADDLVTMLSLSQRGLKRKHDRLKEHSRRLLLTNVIPITKGIETSGAIRGFR